MWQHLSRWVVPLGLATSIAAVAPGSTVLPDALVGVVLEPGARFVAYLAAYAAARMNAPEIAVGIAALALVLDLHVAS